MKAIVACLFFFITYNSLLSQVDQLKELVKEGIEYHDQGDYTKAISKFKAALELDSNSDLANYEISFSYYLLKEYELAAKHSRIVIEQDSEIQLGAIIILGNALDMLGKIDESITVYEEGLIKYPYEHLLNYNLALTLYKKKDYEMSERIVINAILSNPGHASSHLLLSQIMQNKGLRIKAIMPLYIFLLLEPQSDRSSENFKILINWIGMGVSKQAPNSISISLPGGTDDSDDLLPVDLMLGLKVASLLSDSHKNKTPMEKLIEVTQTFFGSLGERKENKKGFWWEFYATRLNDIEKTDNTEAFAYYISQSSNFGNSKEWIGNNPDKIQKLIDWKNK
jgi:tetratricopeptide (TPR) repeat protein